MKPFDGYPGNGRQLLGKHRGTNCRHEYGLDLQRLTKQTSCAYCGISLIETYERWLMLSVDHVIPTKTGLATGIKPKWLEDMSNMVICCSACNSFGNRFELPRDTHAPETVDEFFELRDRTFIARKAVVLECHSRERRFFETKPWESKGAVGVGEKHDKAGSRSKMPGSTGCPGSNDILIFEDDDTGYKNWLTSHESGYVLNCDRSRSLQTARFHLSTCRTITRLFGRGTTFTGQYIKVCSDSIEPLRKWAMAEIGKMPEACGKCKP